jgi:alkaline phosphatase D
VSLEGDWDRRRLGRRGFLAGVGLTVSALWFEACGSEEAEEPASPRYGAYPFTLGVASGDPVPEGVVLWTRLAPDPCNGGGMPDRGVRVRWELAADEGFREVVRRGETVAVPRFAHSVHVEVDGLEPGREYWYRFESGGEISPPGRTKTAPRPGARLPRLAFAFASCQNYIDGYFTAYRNMVDEELDFVLHLGDYVYADYGRGEEFPEAVRLNCNDAPSDLESFRNRYAGYKTDPDLRAAHAAFPFVVAPDDHDVIDDYADEIGGLLGPKEFLELRAAAYRAYWEHLPLRRRSLPRGPAMPVYRRFDYGDLAELNVLDTRQYRSKQPPDPDPVREPPSRAQLRRARHSASTMLGAGQREWLLSGLGHSRAQWNVLAQQIPFAPQPPHFDPDTWDGYMAERQRILEFFERGGVRNPIVVTGDYHANYVRDVPPSFEDVDAEPVASEFIGTSISSRGDPPEDEILDVEPRDPENPHYRYVNNERGYVRCVVDRLRWQTDFRVVDTVRSEEAPIRTVASWVVESGRPRSERA